MERRSFLKWATHGMGALFGLLLGIPALAYVLDPRHRKAAESDFRSVARLNELPENVPTQVVIRDVRRDAWTLHPDDIIGRVWLIRRGDDVTAFTAVCPHLGCSINYVNHASLFICPCHNGTFQLNGQRKEGTATPNPAPRDMDRLECRRDPADPDRIQVRYQTFIQGIDRPILKT
jgi:Rieske Fe-S protein